MLLFHPFSLLSYLLFCSANSTSIGEDRSNSTAKVERLNFTVGEGNSSNAQAEVYDWSRVIEVDVQVYGESTNKSKLGDCQRL